MYRFVDFFLIKLLFQAKIHISHIIRVVAMQTLFNNYHSNLIHNGFKRKHLYEKVLFAFILTVIFKFLSSKVIFITVKECTKMDSFLVGGIL